MDDPAGGTPRLVVLGCGFAGYSLLYRLAGRRLRARLRATLVSPRNYFLFTPLLPSAVSGTVEPRSILEPAGRWPTCRAPSGRAVPPGSSGARST